MDKKEEKQYSPYEAAIKVLNRVRDMYNNSTLAKSNSSHEIETGEEPYNDDAECPESLKGDGASPEPSGKDKKKKSDNQDDSDPEHEQEMDEDEEKEHDAAENEADEMDEDKIEADEEDSDEIINNASKPQKEKKDFGKSENMNKGSVHDMATGKKVADEPSPGYKPERKKKLPKRYAESQEKMRENPKSAQIGRKKVQAEKDRRGIDSHPHYKENMGKSDEDTPRFCKYCGSEKEAGKSHNHSKKSMTNDSMGAPLAKEKPSKLKGFLDNKKMKNKKVEKYLGVKEQQGAQEPMGKQPAQEKPSGMKGY